MLVHDRYWSVRTDFDCHSLESTHFPPDTELFPGTYPPPPLVFQEDEEKRYSFELPSEISALRFMRRDSKGYLFMHPVTSKTYRYSKSFGTWFAPTPYEDLFAYLHNLPYLSGVPLSSETDEAIETLRRHELFKASPFTHSEYRPLEGLWQQVVSHPHYREISAAVQHLLQVLGEKFTENGDQKRALIGPTTPSRLKERDKKWLEESFFNSLSLNLSHYFPCITPDLPSRRFRKSSQPRRSSTPKRGPLSV